MEKLTILLKEDASYSEIVDSVADVLTAGIIIEAQLKDGFQFQDLLSALQVQPIVTEVVNDAPVFVEQFLALKPETATAAILEAKKRLENEGKVLGKVTKFILNGLYALASSYSFAYNAYLGAQNQFLLYQSLIKGGEVFPSITTKSIAA